MSSFNDFSYNGSDYSDESINSGVSRDLEYDSNVNAFNFNELIFNDLILIKNTLIGITDDWGTGADFNDEDRKGSDFNDQAQTATSWSDLS